MSDDMIRFAVMMHADGHYPKHGKRAAICVRKERKKIRIRYLLSILGIQWRESVSPKRPTETNFYFLPPYRGKRFEGRWWQATKAQLAIIIEEMSHWDGLFEDGGTRYFSAYKCDADFIQYAAHSIGYRATISVKEYPEHPTWKPTYIVRLREGAKNCATIRDTGNITRVASADGRQYCFTVPSGFFLARCDDAIYVTGNSGKSSGSVIEIVRRAVAQKPGPDGIRRTRWLVVRNTFAQLDDSTIRTFHMWLPPQYFGKYNSTDHNYTIKAFEGTEIEVWFRALDRPDHVRNLLSVEVTGAWVNEAREVPWTIIDAIDGRIGQYPPKNQGGPTWAGMWMDTNPPDTDSKWYKFFEETKHDPKFAQIFRQPSGLGPDAENLDNLPSANYYKDLARGKSEEYIKVYIKGEYGFVRDGKLIYPEYSDTIHCKAVDPIPGLTIIRSWDWGLTPSCVFSQLLPDGRWLTFDEMVSDNMSADEFSDDVLEHCARAFRGGSVTFEDWGDPAGDARSETDKRTCFQIVQAKGIMVEGSEQDPTMRWESVRKILRTLVNGEPQFILHPRCKVLRKGFLGGYARKRLKVSGPERYSEKADKSEYSHPHDALQYGVVKYFGRQMTQAKGEYDDYPQADHGSDIGRSEITGY